MIFSGRTQMFWGKYSLRESVRRMSELGFDGIEICLENSRFDVMPDTLEKPVIDSVAATCVDCGFQGIAVSCHCDFVNNDGVFNFIKQAIARVKDFGSTIFILGAVGRKTLLAEHPGWKQEEELYKKRMEAFVDLAESHGVVLCVEPEVHCIIRSSQDYLDLLQRIPSSSLCVNFDVGHAFLTDQDPIGMIHTLGNRIVHVHLENMFRGWHNHQLLDQGDMDLRSYVQAFKEIGFRGNIALDLYNHQLEEVAAPCKKIYESLL